MIDQAANTLTDAREHMTRKQSLDNMSKAEFSPDAAIPLFDLFKIVFKKLHPLFSVDCGILLLYDTDLQYITEAYTSRYHHVSDQIISERLPGPIPLNIFQQDVADMDFPILKSKNDWEEEKAGNHCLVNSESHYRYHCYIPLEVNNQILGTLELHNNVQTLSTECLAFCSNIADLLAEAVYLQQQATATSPDNEKASATPKAPDTTNENTPAAKGYELLLGLSIDIAGMKSKDDFVRIVSALRQIPFLPNLVIATVNDDGHTHSAYLAGVSAQTGSSAQFIQAATTRYPVEDGIFNVIAQSSEPVLYAMSDLLQRPDAPGYVHYWSQKDVVQMLGMPLKQGDTLHGVLYLHLTEQRELTEHDINFIKAVAAQFAIAMDNIMAHEQMLKKQQHTNVLLTTAMELSGVRKKDDLMNVIQPQLKRLFNFDHAVIRLLDAPGKQHQIYLSTVAHFNGMLNADLMNPGIYPATDPFFSKIALSDNPVVFDLDEQLCTPADCPGYIRFWYANGIRQIVGTALRLGQHLCGVLLVNLPAQLRHQPESLVLLKGVASQIATAIANVKAYEQIGAQLLEINQFKQQLEDEKLYLQEEIENAGHYAEIIGEGPAMKRVFNLMDQVAGSESTVLILGETGTGKELIARGIHNHSNRSKKLMVKVNCAAIPANLIESELFGHEKGAFTGATDRRIGKFELAHNSTLFLDEIGELPLDLQVKLLRALQEKEIERVGGKTTIKVDVRIVSATNRNLLKEVEEGRFRQDLYYRLNVFPIALPALRERREDIALLASHFLLRFARKSGKKIAGFTQKAFQQMESYQWPGNVREMEHLIERQVLLTQKATIGDMAIPVRDKTLHDAAGTPQKIKTIAENERDYIFEILQLCRGRISGPDGAARLLGVPATTLNSKIKRLGLNKKHF